MDFDSGEGGNVERIKTSDEELEKMGSQEEQEGSGSLKKRESSVRALRKIDVMKQDSEEGEEEEEEEGGRVKKKRRGRRMKSGGDSLSKSNKGPKGRKRKGLESENAEEKEGKSSRKRRSSRGYLDDEEGEDLEGLNLSRQERYRLRNKKMEASSSPHLTKRCRDENVR